MDIQISSNFERLLFDVYDRDGQAIRDKMTDLKSNQRFVIEPSALKRIRQRFDAYRVDETQTLATMARVYQQTHQMIDPHTAVGVGAAVFAREQDSQTPMVVLSTAHPAKFPDAVEKAIGQRPPLPDHLADLYDRPERFTILPNDVATVQAHIRQHRDA